MDFYADPPGTEVEDGTQFITALGGSSANIAVAITRQGGKAALVTALSDDAVGRYVRNQLAHYGIDARHVRTVAGQCRTSLAVVETRLENCQSVIYRNNAADFEMNGDDIDAVDFSQYGALIATGTCFAAEPSRAATFTAFERASAAGLPVILDLDYRPYSWPSPADAGAIGLRAAQVCDLVVGNDEEFATLAGGVEAGKTLARQLAREHGALVVYKMGENGSVTFTGNETIETGIFRVEALKPTGSGDAFLGNLVSALANGFSLQESLVRGSAAAAIVVADVGCSRAMPDHDRLETFMLSHNGIT